MTSVHCVDAAVQVDLNHQDVKYTSNNSNANTSNQPIVNKSLPDLGYESLFSTPKSINSQNADKKTNELTKLNLSINQIDNKQFTQINSFNNNLTNNPQQINDIHHEELIVFNNNQNNNQANNQLLTQLDRTNSINTEGSHESREKWDKKIDFLLSIIGFAVDLANIWRFPYLAYKNGGGVFLIPYTLLLLLGALPLFFLELAIGQFFQAGPVTVWQKCKLPCWKGIGYCAILISWYVSFYYNVIIGWTFYYLYATLTSGDLLPWQHCNNTWNTPSCISILQIANDCDQCKKQYENRTSAAEEFYELKLLEIDKSQGFSDLGEIKIELIYCLIFTFCLLYFSLFKGVKSSGKVVWVTATAPYFILTILLLRGVFLEGAASGVSYYLYPQFDKLFELSVWTEAAIQVFYSVGVGFGVHLTYASFNNRNNNCLRDAMVTVMVNSFTSFYSGFVIFVYLGYIAGKMGKSIDKGFAKEGYGLVFQVYPEAISTLPYAKFWCTLFFLMLVSLGLDSAMGGLEAVIVGLMDEFADWFKRNKINREIFTSIVIFGSFLISLINVTQGGGYTMLWFDTYSAGVSLLCSAMFEAIAIVYFYGLDKFSTDVQSMFNYRPGMFWRICWKYISPLFLLSIVIMSIYQATFEVPTYGDYKFSVLSVLLGWTYSFSSILPIPIIYAYYYFIKKDKSCNLAKSDKSENGSKLDSPPVFV